MPSSTWLSGFLDVKFNGALCATGDYDPELWTCTRDDTPLNRFKSYRRAAQAICHQCPAIRTCAVYALKHPELSGVWGGMLDEQRSELRRRISPVR